MVLGAMAGAPTHRVRNDTHLYQKILVVFISKADASLTDGHRLCAAALNRRSQLLSWQNACLSASVGWLAANDFKSSFPLVN